MLKAIRIIDHPLIIQKVHIGVPHVARALKVTEGITCRVCAARGADVTLHFIFPLGVLMIDYFKCSCSYNTQKQGVSLSSRDVTWHVQPWSLCSCIHSPSNFPSLFHYQTNPWISNYPSFVNESLRSVKNFIYMVDIQYTCIEWNIWTLMYPTLI